MEPPRIVHRPFIRTLLEEKCDSLEKDLKQMRESFQLLEVRLAALETDLSTDEPWDLARAMKEMECQLS